MEVGSGSFDNDDATEMRGAEAGLTTASNPQETAIREYTLASDNSPRTTFQTTQAHMITTLASERTERPVGHSVVSVV